MTEKLEDLIENLCGVMLAVIIILLFLQVILRYSGAPVSVLWASEMSRWIFVWFVFLGAAVLLNRREHMVVDVLDVIISEDKWESLQKIIGIINEIIIYAVLILIFYYSFSVVQSQIGRTATSVEISNVYLYLSLPGGIFLMFIFKIMSLTDYFRR